MKLVRLEDGLVDLDAIETLFLSDISEACHHPYTLTLRGGQQIVVSAACAKELYEAQAASQEPPDNALQERLGQLLFTAKEFVGKWDEGLAASYIKGLRAVIEEVDNADTRG